MTEPRLDILQMRLDGIAQTMQEALFRTAVSPVVREGYDCSCALFTADGDCSPCPKQSRCCLAPCPARWKECLRPFPRRT